MKSTTIINQLAFEVWDSINEYQLAGGGNESYHSLEEICSEFCDLCGDEVAQMITDELWYEYKYGVDNSFGDIYDSEWLPICYLERDAFDWDDFSRKIKHSLRFFDTTAFDRKYELSKLNNFLEKYSRKDLDSIVFRARGIDKKDISKINENPDKELGKVPEKIAQHNRFSPIGISYMYVASDEKTAIQEVFDSSNEIYAVGIFELKKDLNLIDLREKIIKDNMKRYIDSFSDDFESSIYCAAKALKEFIKEVQKPINDKNKILEYLPTQVLAEYIRLLKYDGFIYGSSKNKEGYNIVLFDEKGTYIKHKFLKCL